MGNEQLYTTQLQAGLGVIEETKMLLKLWKPGMSASQLFQVALDSGDFPNLSARRLRNLVSECFAPRYLLSNNYPAYLLKELMQCLSSSEFSQLLFLYTCRANLILADYVREVYWLYYSSGREFIDNEVAKEFVIKATQLGKTIKPWSESTIRRVSSYLSGCCADFGLLEPGTKRVRKILPFRLEPNVAAFLAYDLHFSGLGDNAILSHGDWQLFGMELEDVRNELKRLSLKGFFIVQSAGDVTRISWSYNNWEEFVDGISQG
jgi:hypothetical protein